MQYKRRDSETLYILTFHARNITFANTFTAELFSILSESFGISMYFHFWWFTSPERSIEISRIRILPFIISEKKYCQITKFLHILFNYF